MNLAKARDYFSAYYEGSLDRGLKQTFEAHLNEDSKLQAEYAAFEKTMKGLEAFGAIEIEPPADLHEKISARLDHAIWEQKRVNSRFAGLGWLKLGIMGAAVAAGLVLALFKLNGHSSANVASVFPTGSSSEFAFKPGNQGLDLSYPSVDHATVIIKNANGEVTASLPLNHQGINDKPLENKSDSAQLLSVETEDQSTPVTYVALPGSTRDTNTVGKGTLKSLALALAGHYGKPVIIQAPDDADRSTSWDLSVADELAATRTAVQALNLAVSEKISGVITIEKS